MAFRSSVERWRPLAEMFSGDAPANYLLDWIEKESGGNRCNLTTSAGFPEVGLFQLDPGNMQRAGTDQTTLRSGCDGQTDVGSTDDKITAMSTGVDYVKALKADARAKLNTVGSDWPESDPGFWAIVRLQHAAGTGATSQWLKTAAANLGRGPQNWDEFIANGCCGTLSRNYFDHWTGVAAENGAWAQGFVPSAGRKLSRTEVVLLAIAGIAGLAGAITFDRWLTTGKAV